MAQSEILGLFTTPEQYQQMQQMQQRQMAADFAARSPEQQIRYDAYSAGQRFGGGLAGALGAQDPQLKIIAQRQALAKQIDPADPESYMKAANIAAQGGDQQFAMTLAEYAREAQSKMALIAQRTKEGRAAATPKELQVAAARAQLQDQIAQMEAMDASPERDRELAVAKNTLAGLAPAGEKVPEKIAIANEIDRLTKIVQNLESFGPEAEPQIRSIKARLSFLQGAEKTPSFGAEREAKARSEFGKSFNDLTQTQQKEVEKLVDVSKERTAKAGAPYIAVDTGKASEAAAKKIGEELIDVKNKQSALDSIVEAKKMFNQGIYAGAYGPAKQFVAKYAGIGSADKVANTESFLAFIGETVVPRLKEFGGNDSEQELAYLNKIMGGDITVEPKTLARILDQAEVKIKRGIERLRKQAESGDTKKPLVSTLPSSTPTPVALIAPVQQVRPTHRLNPATGKIEVIK